MVGSMRVARIITRLNIGGPAIQAVNLSSHLSKCGVATLLVHGRVGENEGDMAYLVEQADPSVSTLDVNTMKRQLAFIDDTGAWWQLYRALCAFQPDVVHTHMAKAGALGRLAAVAYNRTVGRRRPARIVHTYHGHVLDGYFGRAATAMFIGIERQLARVTDRIAAVSPRIRDELVGTYRIGRTEQYRVVPLGFELARFAAIDVERRAAARAALQIPASAHVVTTIGRLTAIKNHQLFLDAASQIAHADPSTVFLIAGDGELRAGLAAHAAALGVGDRVRLLGWRRDLEVLYAATDVFLLTSTNEGTPVALIESLAAGCAAVSTDVGGVRDVISTSAIGRLAPAGDATQLANHVLELLADPDQRRRMAQAGREAAVTRYGLNQLLENVLALYQELIA
jgi:glycosyltransferase involved in cell wall biosynthesis